MRAAADRPGVSCTWRVGGIVIRDYQPADREDVLRVWSIASSLVHPFLGQESLDRERYNDPGHHRSGIGRSFVEHARALRGDLEVEVFERNHLGNEFYAALGFQVLHQKANSETGFEVRRLRLAAN